jgi:ubiquinone/menaquinone biosynthesis C-methylase UbiE
MPNGERTKSRALDQTPADDDPSRKESRELEWGGYGTFAEKFDGYGPHIGWVWDVLKENLKALQLNSETTNVLDIGCGTGRSTRGLRLDGFVKAIGVDPDERMIAVARKHNDSIPYYVAPASKLPFDNNSFDAVTIYWAFDNFGNDQASVDEIRRVLRPNGICMVITGTIEGFAMDGRKIIQKYTKAKKAKSPAFVSGGKSSAALLKEKYGFRDVRTYERVDTKMYTAEEAFESFAAASDRNFVAPEDMPKLDAELREFCSKLVEEDKERGGPGLIARPTKLIVDMAFK